MESTEDLSERIGVLLIHGIGEQKRFQHLESEVRNFVSAFAASGGGEARTTVEVNVGSSAGFMSPHESWRSDGAPAIEVVMRDGDRTRVVCFHEAWWADIGEQSSLLNQLKFWFWGLSFWNLAHYEDTGLPGTAYATRTPAETLTETELRRIYLLNRIKLFSIGVGFLLATFSITGINFVLKRLGFGLIPGSRTIVNYIGDVKLFRQQYRSDRGPVNDGSRPPRVAVRRRAITAAVDMALADYSRWYVVAHSLGSIVALNMLMETAHSLPNYIDRTRCSRLHEKGILRRGRKGEDWSSATAPPVDKMLPPRTAWLRDEEVVDRRMLFSRLRGLLTYGSPLDKYAVLWPALVPINKFAALRDDFEWINLHDPLDPVSGALDYFQLTERRSGKRLEPINIAYRTWPILLWSHLKYTRFLPKDGSCAVRIAVEWMLDAESEFEQVLAPHRSRSALWLNRAGMRGRFVVNYVQLALVAALIVLLAVAIPAAVYAYFVEAPKVFSSVWRMICGAFFACLVSALLVGLLGVFRRLTFRDLPDPRRERPPEETVSTTEA